MRSMRSKAEPEVICGRNFKSLVRKVIHDRIVPVEAGTFCFLETHFSIVSATSLRGKQITNCLFPLLFNDLACQPLTLIKLVCQSSSQSILLFTHLILTDRGPFPLTYAFEDPLISYY